MLNKWKKAVVHIECATDEEHIFDKIKRDGELFKKLESGEISPDELMKERLLISPKSREIRSWGTALFLIHNSKRYLVTARDVVWDEKSADREFEEEKERTITWPENRRRDIINSAEERRQNRIFSIIFRVPSYGEINSKDNRLPPFLMNLGAGTTSSHPYTFSSEEIDLAIISLDRQEYSEFADDLLRLGYEPISLQDIDDEPTQEGSEIFTVGFPDSLSIIGTLKRYPVEQWESEMLSYPVFTFGKVSMLNEKLTSFWADMSILPGNSGGPVIEDDKLVGIVRGQASILEPADLQLQSQTLDETSLYVPIPFGLIVKAKYLLNLVKQQEQKEDNFSAFV